VKRFQCPACRRAIKCKVNKLATNYAILEFLNKPLIVLNDSPKEIDIEK
jgi:hypothetical protein